MRRLKISLLGTLEVSINEEPVDISSNYVRALLLFLAIEKHRPHRREILAEMLWPEKPEGIARNSLKQALSNLRKALGDRDNADPFLLISRDEIQINQSSSYWVDAVEVSELIEYVDEHPHSDLMTCNACEKKLLQAVENYRGEFLGEFYLPDNQEFNDWIVIKREFFEQRMVEALRKLVQIFEARGELSVASEYCRQLVNLEPWNEQNHRNLIRLLALNGMRSAALRQYQVCCDNLRDELGVEPSSATVTLYEKIKNWEPGDFPVDLISASLGKPDPLQSQEAVAVEKIGKHQKLSFANIASLIIIGLLGVSLIYWLSTRSHFGSQTPVDPVPSEIENDLSVALQSTETTAPGQTSTSPVSLSVLSNPGIELQALIALYENTDGPNWENSDGWLSDRSPCDWYGITCRGEQIVELELSKNQLKGGIPAEIGQMGYLENLDLGNNQLSGNIPLELGNLSRLRYLTLWGNRELSGSIPPELGNLSNLEEMNLAHWESGGSLLSGEIPQEFGNLKKLASIRITKSLLRGPFPVELCGLTNLDTLDLASNQLSGPIPPEIGNLRNLEFLDLGGNDFEGPIPSEIGNLTMLTYLSFGGSLVSGEIPSELGNLVRLRHLVLDNTGLSGPMPLSLMNLNLRQLTFWGTELCEPADEDFQAWLNSIKEANGTKMVCEP